jgi:PAS domain S-box-containing protein
VLGLGVFMARPDQGLSAIFSSPGAGGLVARQIIPAAVVVPIVFAWLRLQGQLAGWYDMTFGLALFALSNIVFFSALLGWLAARLRAVDAERETALENLRQANETLEQHVAERTAGLAASEARFRLLAENATDLIARTTPDGVFLYASPAARRLLGFDPDAMVGLSAFEVVHPDDLAGLQTVHQILAAGPETRTFQYRVKHADGEYVWLESTAHAIFSHSGRPLEIASSTRDITRRKQAEAAIQRMNDDLKHQAAELEATNAELEAFGHTIAHDLKAPLATILGYASLLRDIDETLSEETRQVLHTIDDEILRMARMVDSLLLLARVRHGHEPIEPVAMGPVIQAALERFKEPLARRGFQVDVPRTCPRVLGYGPWLEEVFANLIGNAIKYMSADTAQPRLSLRGRARSGIVRYEVADNGLGIRPEDQERLFDMFSRFHTRQAGGFGLGLSIVARIVTRLGGQVGVDSEPGQGSTFWFNLPAVTNHR